MSSLDMLNLGEDLSCTKMLLKMGDNYPLPERVILSVKLSKINRKGKEQTRILMLTNKLNQYQFAVSITYQLLYTHTCLYTELFITAN